RTLETNMCSVPAWDEERITATVAEMWDRREKFDRELLTSIPDSKWRLWLYGLLHRHRLRGALEHPYVDSYVRVGAGWGKTGFRRKLIPGRQTHPPTGRFQPQVLVDQPEKGHDHLLEPSRQSSRPPWPIRWTRLALDSRIDEGTAIDLLREVLRQGTATGLFRILRQDGPKTCYAIAAGAARLVAGDAVALQCSDTKRYLFRPAAEGKIWKSSPSRLEAGAPSAIVVVPTRYASHPKGELRPPAGKLPALPACS
ncbi:MAG: hypothetical protein GY856_09075, partial [bacterium]|nr:hypothetical protein [bacterium]